MGHSETFLFGLVGTIWNFTRLFSGTLTHFLGGWKIFLQAHYARFLSAPLSTLVVLVFGEICLPSASRLVFLCTPVLTRPFGTLGLSQDIKI